MELKIPEPSWTLDELANRAGISPRTVRFYVQRGLIPAPLFRGPRTIYPQTNLVRLQAIRRLQERFLPLDAIKLELQRMTFDQMRLVAKGGTPPSLATSAAPTPPSPPTTTVDESATWQRWQLAPGLELQLSQNADDRSRALAERIRELARAG